MHIAHIGPYICIAADPLTTKVWEVNFFVTPTVPYTVRVWRFYATHRSTKRGGTLSTEKVGIVGVDVLNVLSYKILY